MKVGDYVRTKDGLIGKIIQEEYITPCNDKHRYIYLIDKTDEMWFDEDTIIKSSPNIIDLIEEDDFINQMRVSEIIKKTKDSIRFMADSDYEFSTELKEKEIKSVITDEQFESMEYKL